MNADALRLDADVTVVTTTTPRHPPVDAR